MNEKIYSISKIVIILILMVGLLIFKFLPEYKSSQGSSDTYIDTNLYQDIIEFKINDKPNFALVTDKNKIINILFFDHASLCLYNKNIENSTISDGIKQIVELLIENDYLKQNTSITITKYQDITYSAVKSSLTKQFVNLGIEIDILEKTTTIEQKGKDLGITGTTNLSILKQIEMYSKNTVRHGKNNVSTSSTSTKPEQEELTENLSREYTDTVYKKIEVYMKNNNIANQDVSNPVLPITSIPANKEGTIYPDATSWYYIKDSKVYAYISITKDSKNYSYCYLSSIDEYKKGQC